MGQVGQRRGPARWHPSAGAGVVAASAAGLVVSLDTTVNIAFPAITASFHLEVSQIQWVVISYVLTFASLLLATGRLGDALGHRRMLVAGMAVTAVGVLLCGVAPAFGWFLAARVVQGVGAALVLGAAPALVTLLAPEHERSRALGGFQLGAGLGVAVGPALGGALLNWTSWRSVYLFRAPLAVLVAVVVVGAVPPDDGATRRARRQDGPLDLTGAFTVGAGMAAALLALSRVRDAGWGAPLVVGGLVAAVVLLTTWVVVERRSRNPVVDLALLRHTPFSVANGLNLAANATMFAIWLLAPYYLLTVRGLSTIVGGVVLGAAPLATAVASPLAGRLDGRVATGRLCTIGLALEAIGLAAVAAIGAHTPVPLVGAAFALVGFGLGVFTVPNLSYVMGSIPRRHQGVAGGLSQMMRTVGVVGGVAGASLFFDARRRARAAGHAGGVDDAVTFMSAFRDTFVLVAVVCTAAAVVALARPPGPPAGDVRSR